MFKCDRCGKVTESGEKQHKIVVSTRGTSHPFRKNANRFKRAPKEKDPTNWHRSDSNQRVVYTDDPGGLGRQIVREIVACERCDRPDSSS